MLLALLATPAVAGTDHPMSPRPRLVVRGYPQTNLQPRDLDMIRDVVTRAFEDAIDVTWQVCGTRRERAWTAACDRPLGSSDLALRFMDDRGGERPEVLGIAAEGSGHLGVMATVFVNRVKAVAARTGLKFAPLAGRVSAHEMVHLLLGAGSHRGVGLMRPDWSEEQLHGRPEEWRISVAQRRALGAAVRQRAETD